MVMKIILAIFVVGMFCPNAWGQNIIKVSGPYTKKVVYTLKENEDVFLDESNIHFINNITNYEFTTRIDNAYYLHSSNDKKGPLRYFPQPTKKRYAKGFKDPNQRKYQCVANNDKFNIVDRSGKILQKNVLSPITSLEYLYLNPNLEDLNGYAFISSNNMKWYCKVDNPDMLYGPFDILQLYSLSKSKVFFSYRTEKGFYIRINETAYGPYEEIKIHNPYAEGTYDFSYRNEKGWYIYLGKNYGPFKEKPIYSHSRFAYIKEAYDNYPGYFLLQSGIKIGAYDNFDANNFFYFPSTNTWIKFEKKALNAPPQNKTFYNRPTYYLTSNLFAGEKGPYHLPENYTRGAFGEYNSFYSSGIVQQSGNNPQKFTLILNETDDQGQISYRKYLLTSDLNLYGPFEELKAITYVGSSLWFVAGKDHTLFKDNVQQKFKNVESFGMNESGKISMKIKEDSLVTLYEDFQPIFKYKEQKYFTIAKKYDDGYYLLDDIHGDISIQIPKKNRTIGPFSVNGAEDIILNKDASHFAVNSWSEITIDHKAYGSGFSLCYSNTNNSYHWFSLEGRNVILHTYELD